MVGVALGRWLWPLGLYLVLVGWLTWPLSLHLATHLPATRPALLFDTLRDAWALSYESRALVTDPARLGDANIYHPDRNALYFGRPAFVALPHFLPLFLLTANPALALNFTFLSGSVLTAWALHLVVRRWTASDLAGFVAGWTFLMTRWTLWEWAPMLPAYACLYYLPPIMLLAAAPERRRALPWLAAAIVMQGLLDIYLAVAVVVPLAVLAAFRLARATSRGGGLRLAVTVVLSSLALVGAYSGALRVRLENPQLRYQSLWSAHPRPVDLPRDLAGPLAATAVPTVALVLIVIGAVVAARDQGWTGTSGRAWAVAALFTTLGVLMTLGPAWQGILPGPLRSGLESAYALLRFPLRLGIPALTGACALAGLAMSACLRASDRRSWPPSLVRPCRLAFAALLVVSMYADYALGLGAPSAAGRRPLPATYPVTPPMASDSSIVRALQATGGPLLELPVAPRSILLQVHSEAMYRSIFHRRPILNGYGSYWPSRFPERMALAARLPHPDALTRLRRETNVAMILVRTAWLPRGARDAWLTLASGSGRNDLRLVEREGSDLLFAVHDPVASDGHP